MYIGHRKFQQLSVGYIIAWMIAPPLAYDMIYRLLAIGAAALWLVIEILFENNIRKNRNGKMAKALSTYIGCAVIYSISLILFDIIFKNYSFGNAFYNNITTFIFLFVGYIGGIYCKEQRYDELKKLFIFLVLVVVLFSITSIMRSEEFYLMTRNAGGEVSDEYNALARSAAKHGVGGFGFFAFGGAFAPLLFWCSYAYRGYKKVGMILAFVIVEIGVFSAGYTLALIISFVGIILTVFFKVRSLVMKLIFFLTGVFLILMWDDFVAVLYDFFQTIANGTMYANKVEDIFSFLIGGDSTGTFESRQERYLLSLRSIFRYPVFGSYILNDSNSIGHHSSILDVYAAYGWGIGFAWTYIIVLFPKKMAEIFFDKRYSKLVMAVLFFTALFNRTTMMMGIFFVVVPAISYIEKINRRKIKM